MARFPQILQFPIASPAGRRISRSTSAQAQRPVRRGLFVALLAVLLGVGLGFSGPVAHAAPANAVSTAAVPNTSCSIHRIARSPTYNLGNGLGYYYSILWARYDAQGNWCNNVWGEAYMVEFPGAPHGTLRLFIYNCNSSSQAVFGIGVNGGGAPGGGGLIYYANSFNYNWSYVGATAQFTTTTGYVYGSTTTSCINT